MERRFIGLFLVRASVMIMYFCLPLLLCIFQVSSTTDNYAYYSPGFPLTWLESEMYCETQCDSNLATIPDSDQIRVIIDIFPDFVIIDIEGVWIGLEKADANASYEWVENTNNTFYDYDSSTWTHDCIYLSLNDNQLHDASCDTISTFVCNSCDEIIHKYVLTLKEEMTQRDAQYECEDLYDTTLASIHSQSDYEEAINLCQIYGNYSCWIGLGYVLTEETWEWSDGTTFDFGSYWGEYPWNDSPTVGKPCVYIHYDEPEWIWNFGECTDDSVTAYPLCNMRSELLCADPYIVEGNEDSINFRCSDHSIGDDEYTMVIFDAQFPEDSETAMVIEFMFSIATVDTDRSGNGGFFITESYVPCSLIYINILVNDDISASVLSLEVFIGGVSTLSDSEVIPTNISNSEYYVLRVYASLHESTIDVSLNNISMFYHTFGSIPVSPGNVGMITNNVVIIGKYLYVSGTYMKMTDVDVVDAVDALSGCSFIDTYVDDDDYITTDYNENTYTESVQFEPEEVESVSPTVVVPVIIVVVAVFVLICIGLSVYHYRSRKKKNVEEMLAKTKEQTELATKQKAEFEQETKKELEERDRKHNEMQQQNDERIQKLEEELKQMRELQEQCSSDVMMEQPGLPGKTVKFTSSFEVEESDTTGEFDAEGQGVPGNQLDVEHHEEGYQKGTQIDSAVRLDIPQAAFVSNRNIYETNDGGNTAASTGDDEKGVMDEMLSDVLKMKSSDPNIVTQLSVINDVENKADDDTDTESDNMYDNDDNEQRKDAKDVEPQKTANNGGDAQSLQEDAENELNADQKEKKMENEGVSNGIGKLVSQINVHSRNDDDDSGNSDDMYDRNVDEDKGHSQDLL